MVKPKQKIINGYLNHGVRRDCCRPEFFINEGTHVHINSFPKEYLGKTVRIKIEVVENEKK